MTVIGNGTANAATRSTSPRAANASTSSSAISRIRGSITATRLGVNRRFTTCRWRVCSGGSAVRRHGGWRQSGSSAATSSWNSSRPRSQSAVRLREPAVDEGPFWIAELRREALVVSEHLHRLVVPCDRVGPQLLDPCDGPGLSKCAKMLVRVADRGVVELEQLGELGRRARYRRTMRTHSRNEVSSATIERATSGETTRGAAGGLGLLHRAGVRGTARLDARVRPRGDLADRGDRARHRPGAARPDLRAAPEAGEGAGPVGRPPPAGARRPGLRPGQARPDERDPRHVDLRLERVRLPGARLRQQRDPRARRHARAEGALALPAARGRAPVRVLDDRAGDAGLGPDAAADAGRARRRRLRPQRAQVVHVERLDRRLPDRDGRHRPRRGAARSARRCSSSRPTRRA